MNQIIGASQEKHLIYVDGQEFTLIPSVPMKGLTADRNIRILLRSLYLIMYLKAI